MPALGPASALSGARVGRVRRGWLRIEHEHVHAYVHVYVYVYVYVYVIAQPRAGAADEAVMLDHEKLDAYRASIEFLAIAHQVMSAFPRGQGTLADQLRRASTSIPLNIAEAVGRTSRAERLHHYAIARGSALECGAVLDAARVLQLAPVPLLSDGKAILERIVMMLSRLCRPSS